MIRGLVALSFLGAAAVTKDRFSLVFLKIDVVVFVLMFLFLHLVLALDRRESRQILFAVLNHLVFVGAGRQVIFDTAETFAGWTCVIKDAKAEFPRLLTIRALRNGL